MFLTEDFTNLVRMRAVSNCLLSPSIELNMKLFLSLDITLVASAAIRVDWWTPEEGELTERATLSGFVSVINITFIGYWYF